jgi:hypothetical protein
LNSALCKLSVARTPLEERAIPERATRDLAPAEQDRALASGRASVSAGPPGVGGKLLPRGAGLTTRQRIGLE